MKIKTDFITNSSSSSFVAWGVGLDEIEIPDGLLLAIFQNKIRLLRENRDTKGLGKWEQNELTEMETMENNMEAILDYVRDIDFEEKAEILTGGAPLFEINNNDYGRGIGVTPQGAIQYFPETPLKDLKQAIAEKLNAAFGTSFTKDDIGYFEECWFDG